MRLTIFGASGRTGRHLVDQALAQGHTLVALVRDPAKLAVSHANLTIIQGDATDPAAVERAIAGSDAVISALGHVKGSPPDIQATATRQIIAAMERQGVRRLVSLTGAGVAAPQDRPKLIDRVIKLALMTLSGAVLRDAEAHTELIRSSNLAWVIVRGPMLTDAARTGAYRVGWVGVGTSSRITRADLADFMLTQVSDSHFLRQLPMVSN